MVQMLFNLAEAFDITAKNVCVVVMLPAMISRFKAMESLSSMIESLVKARSLKQLI
jgi:hypothetical protein